MVASVDGVLYHMLLHKTRIPELNVTERTSIEELAISLVLTLVALERRARKTNLPTILAFTEHSLQKLI